MYFYYDMNGRPYGLQYNGNIYYYLLNAQGDVIRMLDSTGATAASYEYDPFGNIISATGPMAEANPLRYRGYYYDRETGFYYLNSRYYDPKTGRFINADSYVSTGQGIVGYNMFAYCGNNPVNMSDPMGYFASGIITSLLYKVIVMSWGEVSKEKLMADIENFDINNSDISKVFEASYFSAYNGVPVIRHSIEGLNPFAINGMIVLNNEYDDAEEIKKENILKHEYGHILQERELGKRKYIEDIFLPSVTTLMLSRINPKLQLHYYDMPWEYDADIRGGVTRSHADWAEGLSKLYFSRRK